MERVDTTGGAFACWPWLGNINDNGYGRYRAGGRIVYAHRFALEGALGRALGQGMCACHHCDNPPCVNPLHLFEGTQADNQHDKWVKGRNFLHPALTPREVAAIRRDPRLVRALAPDYPGVSVRTLYRVRAGVGPYQRAAA